MIQKTELMQQFEKENPGKNAIWANKITNQFKKWKKDKLSSKEFYRIDKIEYEIVLFLALSKIQKPTYNKIMEFCTSFGIKSNEIIGVLSKKIKEGEILYILPVNSNLKNIIEDLLNLKNIKIPLTIRVNEALDIFKNLNFQKPIDVVDFFKSLKKNFPSFISLSSSKLNQREDLITFNQLFPEVINFKLNNRWAI